MAPHPALLGLLMTALFAGCLSGPSAHVEAAADPSSFAASSSAQANATNGSAQPNAPPPAAAPAEPAGCKDDSNSNNNGFRSQIGDTYIISPYDGKVLVIYKETNGRRGLQTESMCPKNPDSKIAEVPYPMALLTPTPAGKA